MLLANPQAQTAFKYPIKIPRDAKNLWLNVQTSVEHSYILGIFYYIFTMLYIPIAYSHDSPCLRGKLKDTRYLVSGSILSDTSKPF